MKIVAIVGPHNAGKTTLIQKLIPALRQKGYEVGYIKHDPKGHALTDKEGSDTHRISTLTKKRAIISPDRFTYWEKTRKDPVELAKELFHDCDIVILEGFKEHPDIPKIVLGELEVPKAVMKVKPDTPLADIIKVIEETEEIS
ncbi:MAG: molybdopterin-guanine dinucleotide biosynthesis protein B [Aquificae bacterium]|nr:molybdopterin-guanine dinucleotide biosynthesis protein B [Aquificota bacterium]